MWGHNRGHISKTHSKIINKFNMINHQMRLPVTAKNVHSFNKNTSNIKSSHLAVPLCEHDHLLILVLSVILSFILK